MKKQTIYSPWDGAKVAEVDLADELEFKNAIDAAEKAASTLARTTRAQRAELLTRVSERIALQRAEYARLLIAEAGKPRDLAEGEVRRAITTFQVAAMEARAFAGSMIPMNAWESGAVYADATCLWVPRGPVFGITPFNYPINLVAHKVAPAIAAGCPILIKPAPQTPSAAHALCRDVSEAAREMGKTGAAFENAFQCWSAENEVSALGVVSAKIKTLSFTGSDAVGWQLKSAAGKKVVSLELGGNAAVIIDASANLALAVERCVWGGYAYAGQSCISVQRVYVLDAVFDAFLGQFSAAVAKLKCGDPSQSGVLVGPVINAKAVEKILSHVEAAVKGGARLLCGGGRSKENPLLLQPMILTNTQPSDAVMTQEIFGPVVCVERVASIPEAIRAVNASRFGLQASVFTDSQTTAERCAREIEAGGIAINDAPTARVDHMPYGGVKDSGLGREGLRYAMEEFSERKLIFARKTAD